MSIFSSALTFTEQIENSQNKSESTKCCKYIHSTLNLYIDISSIVYKLYTILVHVMLQFLYLVSIFHLYA